MSRRQPQPSSASKRPRRRIWRGPMDPGQYQLPPLPALHMGSDHESPYQCDRQTIYHQPLFSGRIHSIWPTAAVGLSHAAPATRPISSKLSACTNFSPCDV